MLGEEEKVTQSLQAETICATRPPKIWKTLQKTRLPIKNLKKWTSQKTEMHRKHRKKTEWKQHVAPDFPNAFIRLECVMEIARSSRGLAQNNAKDNPKWEQKSLKIGSWRPLGSLSEPLGRLLGAFWGQLQKKLKKTHFFWSQLGSQNATKIYKNQCQKTTCFET